MYRVMIVRMPKSIGSTVTSYNNSFPFEDSQIGAAGKNMVLPLDTDRDFKSYYDHVFNIQTGVSGSFVGQGRELHKLVNIRLTGPSYRKG